MLVGTLDPEANNGTSSSRWPWAVGSIILTVLVLRLVAFRGWIPHDEGTLAQAASRILDGQWPHDDFLDVYPGLLGVIHAGVFAVLGESFHSLRVAWLGVGGLTSGAAFLLLNYRLPTMVAAVGATASTVFGLVMYPASMPSWWNVGLGMVAVLLAYEGATQGRRLLVLVAGLIVGASILIKSNGGIFVAMPVFLWLLSRDSRVTDSTMRLASFAGLGAIAAVALGSLSIARSVLFGLPASIGVLLIHRSRSAEIEIEAPDVKKSRLARVFGLSVVALPVLVVGIYAATGRIEALVDGWILSPALRFEVAEGNVPALASVGLLIVGAFIAMGVVSRDMPKIVWVGAPVVAMTAWAILNWASFGSGVVASTVVLPLLTVILVVTVRRTAALADPFIVLTVAVAGSFALVQIPLWNSYYTAYTIPLSLLALFLAFPGLQVNVLAAILLLAGAFVFQSLSGRLIGPVATARHVEFVELNHPRIRLSVPEWDSYYEELATFVHQIAGDRSIYAGPDAPEVAFIAGVDDAARSFYEALDLGWDYSIPVEVAESGSPVVINQRPGFSNVIPEAQLARIYAHNESVKQIGKFQVTWSDATND